IKRDKRWHLTSCGAAEHISLRMPGDTLKFLRPCVLCVLFCNCLPLCKSGCGIGLTNISTWSYSENDLSATEVLWSWRNGNRRFMDIHGERPKVLRRVR